MSNPDDPSGRPPPHQQATGQQATGQQATGQQAPGQQPLPPYSSYQPSKSGVPSLRRPGTVSWAGGVTIVLSSISIICGIVGIAVSAAVVDYMTDHPADFDLSAQEIQSPNDIRLGFIVVSVLLIVFAILAITMAVFVLHRQQWARIILTVLCGLTILAGAFGSIMVIGAPWLIAGIVVTVLLYTGGANTWFASRDPAAPHY